MRDHPQWDDSYTGAPPPWDIGRPQQPFVDVAAARKLQGAILDAGCGTGEHALLAAAAGAEAVGIDISPRAIQAARDKARARGLQAEFVVGSTLELDGLARRFDAVIDSGMFHVFDDSDRARYVAGLASALRPGGTVYLMCFSDRQPGEMGPRRVRQSELYEAFADGWVVESIAPARFEVRPPLDTAEAWFATIRRK